LCNIPYPFATTRAKKKKKSRRETDKQPLFPPLGVVLNPHPHPHPHRRPSISSILIRIGIALALLLLFCCWLTTPNPSKTQEIHQPMGSRSPSLFGFHLMLINCKYARVGSGVLKIRSAEEVAYIA